MMLDHSSKGASHTSESGEPVPDQLVVDIQWKAITEAASLLAKGMAFYLTIMAALIGYIVAQDVPRQTQNGAIAIALVTCVFAAAAGIALFYGIFRGLYSLDQSLERISPTRYKLVDLQSFFRRGRRIAVITFVCSMMLLATFALGVALLLS